MTDNEIIKALECCEGADTDCWECELFDSCKSTVREIMQDALSLINRQKAEIERLKANNAYLMLPQYARKTVVETAKAEAIKEFAERLKTKASDFGYGKAVWVVYIDNLVKEMVGDGE